MARILLPLTVEPADLEALAWEVLADAFPGWTPSQAHIETILVQADAQMDADVLYTLSGVGDEIFRYFGRSIHDIPPGDPAPATGLSTWTAVDNAGYPIPHGTTVAVTLPDGDVAAFSVVGDHQIAAGQTSLAGVALEAVEDGAHTNSATGPVELDTPLDYILTIALDVATGGGVDREDDEAYLDRLSEELQLQSPRPVLPDEFAVLARRVAGVYRAVVLDNFYPGNNEIQQVAVTGATGGTFTLTFNAQTTAAIAHNATAATVQAELEALTNVNPGDVIATRGPLGTDVVNVEFAGQHGLSDVAQMTADGALLTGTGAAVAVSTPTAGVAPNANNERMVTVGVVDEQGERVPLATRQAVDADLQAKREVNFQVHVIDPVYTTIAAAVTVQRWPEFEATAVQEAVEFAVAQFLSPATWGLPQTGETPDWHDQPIVRSLDLADAVGDVESVRSVVSVALNGTANANVTLAGPIGLPRSGTITVTVEV